MSKNITPKNKEGKRHGYREWYRSNGKLMYKGYYVNGDRHGYWERYWSDGKLWYKGYWANGELVGYCEEYWFKEIQIFI